MPTDKITLQTILQRGHAAYERTHRLPDDVRRAHREQAAARLQWPAGRGSQWGR